MLIGAETRGLSRSTEDYLKAIFGLAGMEGRAVQTTAIADALGVAPPSVSGMLRRLADGGLLAHVPYRGVRLTDGGRQAALRVMRRHRILECYLTSRLGYDWDSVHAEAERLEPRAEALGENPSLVLDEREQERALLAIRGLKLVVENHGHGEKDHDERHELRAERSPDVLGTTRDVNHPRPRCRPTGIRSRGSS